MSPTIRKFFLAATLMLMVSPTTGAWGSGICSLPQYQDKLTLEPNEEYYGAYTLIYWNSDRQCSESIEQGVSFEDLRIQVKITVGHAPDDNREQLIITDYPKSYMLEPKQSIYYVKDGEELRILLVPGLF